MKDTDTTASLLFILCCFHKIKLRLRTFIWTFLYFVFIISTHIQFYYLYGVDNGNIIFRTLRYTLRCCGLVFFALLSFLVKSNKNFLVFVLCLPFIVMWYFPWSTEYFKHETLLIAQNKFYYNCLYKTSARIKARYIAVTRIPFLIRFCEQKSLIVLCLTTLCSPS